MSIPTMKHARVLYDQCLREFETVYRASETVLAWGWEGSEIYVSRQKQYEPCHGSHGRRPASDGRGRSKLSSTPPPYLSTGIRLNNER